MKKFLLISFIILCLNSVSADKRPWEYLFETGTGYDDMKPVFYSIANQSNASARLLSAPPPTIKLYKRAGMERISVETLGPVVAERASGLEPGDISVALTFADISFDKYKNENLDVAFDGIVQGDDNSAIFKNKILSLNAFYGFNSKITIGVIIPYIDATYSWNMLAPGFPWNASKSGIGDIVVRTQYLISKNREKEQDIALVGEVKFSTGDENWLLGTGKTDYKLGLLYSKMLFVKNTYLGIDANLGYTFNSGIKTKYINMKDKILDYKLGLNYALTQRITLLTEYIGRAYDNKLVDDTQDLSIGLKFLPKLKKLVLSAIYIIPLNDNKGLRSNGILSIGASYQF